MISHKKICLADFSEVLYKLRLEDKVSKVFYVYISNSSSIPTSALWHFRLGRLSHSRLSLMNKQFPFLRTDKILVCHTFHFAKQKKIPFCIVTKRDMNKFEILHFDI